MSASLFGVGNAINANVAGTLVSQLYTLFASQSAFVITGFTYTINTGSLLVWINGQKQVSGKDFTETSTSTFTLFEAALAGDIVEIIGFPSVTLTAVNAGSVVIGGSYTLASHLSNEDINVKDYPYLAVADGVTTDTAAFNSAGSIAGKSSVKVPAGTYLLSTIPTPTNSVTWELSSGTVLNGSGNTLPGNTIKKGNFVGSWVDSVAVSGVGSFAYLPGNATFTALPRPSSIGIFSGVRASTGAGGAAEANIGVSAFAYGNFVGGSSGVWGLYSTVLRASGFTGYTHGMEIDVSNFGSNVALTPNNIVSPGQTDGIWLACGGEAATNFVNGISSVAIGILRNDPHALTGPADTRSRFGAAIVVHNQALLGTDGATGQGVFASLATGQAIQWTNNSNGIAGFYYVAAGTTNGAGTGIVSDNTGLNVQATFDNKVLFNVRKLIKYTT